MGAKEASDTGNLGHGMLQLFSCLFTVYLQEGSEKPRHWKVSEGSMQICYQLISQSRSVLTLFF